MKNLILFAVTVLMSTVIFAQTTESKKTETKKTETKKVESKKPEIKDEKRETNYCCPKCDFCSTKAGSCPHHSIPLGSSETKVMYCCGHCDWTIPPVKGACHHSTLSVYKDGTLYCVFCSNKGGKCPNCGMAMEKIIVKKKKAKS